MEITVVSDGSTDRTVDYAKPYTDRIKLIVFPDNRGYGAAIKESWRESDAELLGFLDADGTCMPSFFSELCDAVLKTNADVALGCRLDPTQPNARRSANREHIVRLAPNHPFYEAHTPTRQAGCALFVIQV